MEFISKNNSLETAKNRLDISGLTYIQGTQYVYDRILNKETNDKIIKYLPLIESENGYILRYKNLIRQYYWLVNEFIPSCSYEKLCIRKGKKTWIQYDNPIDALRKYFTFSFYNNDNLIISISVASGNTATPFTPSKDGYNFIGWTTSDGGNTFFDFNTPISEDTNVYAKYAIKEVEIRFVLNNGQPDVVIFVNYGSTPSIQEPEKEGYTFNGWYPEISEATVNATYEATYTQDIYIVRFFDIIDSEHVLNDYGNQPINSGSTSEYRLVRTETSALHGQSSYYLTQPTYQHFECIEESGYTWWIDREGNPISASTFLDITHDILEVYPKLTKKNYNVLFLDWDNSMISQQTVTYLDDATAPNNPSRPNYTFIGWDRSYTGIANDTIIHARYIGDTLNVIYMLPDMLDVFTIYSSVTTTFNSTAPIVENPSTGSYPPEDYGVFDGWYTDDQYTSQFDYTSLLHSDTVIYGKWKTEFSVTFYNWDGTLITGDTQTGFANPVYVGYGGDVTDAELDLIIENMTDKPGYEFLGWSMPTTGITSDTRVTAVFDETQMCLVRFINDFDGSIISSVTVPFGSTILVSDYPQAPEVENMVFNRWDGYTSEVFSDTDVYAIYVYTNITVSFIDYYKNELGSETVAYGQTGQTPNYIVEDATARGYNGNEDYVISTLRFNGTYCLVRDEFDPETGCSTPEETIITEKNNTFMAQYDEIATSVTTCNVAFYNYESIYLFTDTVMYGTVIDGDYSSEVVSIMEASGYTPDPNIYEFYGWEDGSGNEYIIGQNNPTITGDISLYAKYRLITYNVQFFVQSNPEYYPDLIDLPIHSLETIAIKNTGINRPDCSNVPERIYFETFCEGLNNRWYTNPSCTIEWVFKQDVQMQPVANPDLVTDNMILYGKYVGREYTLTYDTNSGSSIPQETYRYPVPTVRPADPTKGDGTFIGWYTDNETFENEFVFGQTLKSNTTIYAKWFEAPEENTLIYNATADLKAYMPDMGSAHLLQEHCVWDILTGDGILVYDAPIETLNIGTLNQDNSVTVNTEIKRNLRKITIPSKTENVVIGQFEDCRYLNTINVTQQTHESYHYYSNNGILWRDLGGNSRLECYPQAKVGNSFILEDFNSGEFIIVGEQCFANCKNLKYIRLNNLVMSLESKAFKNCTNLEEITCSYEPYSYVTSDTFDGVDVENCKLYVPCRSYNDYINNQIWSQFDIQCFGSILYLDNNTDLVIEDNILTEDGINVILTQHNVNRSNVIGAEIGLNVTSIDDSAFSGCTNLTSITLQDSVTNIGDDAFSNCHSLGNVVIADSVTEIGKKAFYNCSSLSSLTIGSGVTVINNQAFQYTSLEYLFIPYTVSQIGCHAFSDCTGLTSIETDRITPAIICNNSFDNTNNCPIYVPCSAITDYTSDSQWSTYEDRFDCRSYVKFTSLSGDSTIRLSKISTNQTFEYSFDQYTWSASTTANTGTITLSEGDEVYFRGILRGDNSSSNYSQFSIGGKVSVSGNINNLWNYNNLEQPLYKYCGANLFRVCYGLIEARELVLGTSATTLADGCYGAMFYNCQYLISGPELPAINLVTRCYSMMFYKCERIEYIKCLAESGIDTDNSTTKWISGTTDSGVYFEMKSSVAWPSGYNGINPTWTKVRTDFTTDTQLSPVNYLTFTAREDSFIGFKNISTNQTVYLSQNLTDWVTFTNSESKTCFHINSGETIYLCGRLSGANSNSDYTNFIVEKIPGYINVVNEGVKIDGNINSLWNYQNLSLYAYCGYELFRSCHGLIDISGLIFPTANKEACYLYAFQYCSNLRYVPILPATSLGAMCYQHMFSYCTSLTTIPSNMLPATTINGGCYAFMFNGCSKLTNTPTILPATALTQSCYASMFSNCSLITTAPELPATGLTTFCYLSMFYGCSNLNYIKCLAVSGISESDSTTNWVSGVPTGQAAQEKGCTFIQHPDADWGSPGVSSIPDGWAVSSA
jgi:uncharacterized repeat protein (TIGR02543 family)